MTDYLLEWTINIAMMGEDDAAAANNLFNRIKYFDTMIRNFLRASKRIIPSFPFELKVPFSLVESYNFRDKSGQ